MWLSYDHYSDYCPTYRIPFESRHNMDIIRATKREWKKRRELEQVERSKMPRKRPSRHSSNDGFVPFDTFELTQTPLVDVDQLYMEHILNQMQAIRQAQGSGALNRKEFEINMRQFRIIGGIHCLDYFEQPEQCVKLASNMYLKTGKFFQSFRKFSANCFDLIAVVGTDTLKRREFFQYFRAPPATPAGVRRLPEEIEAEMKMVERGLGKLSYITIT